MDTVHVTEEWRPVEGWPYHVSNLGRVRRMAPQNNTWVGRILTPVYDGMGYRAVHLHGDGRHRQIRIAVLVCGAFHAKPSPAHVVRHLNGVCTDDHADNLAWGTRKENVADMLRHGTHQCGERSATAKLSWADVAAIRAEYAALGAGRWPFGRLSAIAARYGVCKNQITRVVQGKCWSFGP